MIKIVSKILQLWDEIDISSDIRLSCIMDTKSTMERMFVFPRRRDKLRLWYLVNVLKLGPVWT